jgi:outer membrane immunogenic protein
MRHWLCTISAAALLASGTAFAADLGGPPPAPVPPPPIFTWTGFYIGADIGGIWTTDKLTETTTFFSPPLTGSASLDGSGVIGGLHAGYNWQAGSWVYGLEGDFQATSLKTTSTCLIQDAGVGNPSPGACFAQANGAVYTGYNFSTELPWQGSVRGRLGYAFGNALLYATGGVAFADIRTTYTTFGGSTPGSESFDQTRAGLTVGAGLEYALSANLSARVEYRFSDFGTLTNPITSGGAFWNHYMDSHSVQENAVLFGISYKFGAPPPPVVAARY